MIRVCVAVALPGRQEVIDLDLPEGSSVCDALAAARLEARFPGERLDTLRVGIWSREASPATALRDGDRVELYRALKADPKAVRRARSRLKPSRRSRNAP